MTDLEVMLTAAFAPFAAMFLLLAATLIASGRGSARLRSARSFRLRCHLGSLWTARATAGAVATVAFSHLGGCLLRRAATPSRGYC